MKKIITMVLSMLIVLSLMACSDNSGGASKRNGITQMPCEIAIHDYFITSFSGEPYIVLYLDVTNKSDKSLPANDLANPTLYQNGSQVSDIGDDDSWMKKSKIVYPEGFEATLRYNDKIQSGATGTVYYVLPIKNTTDDITVEVYGGEELVTDDGGTYIRVSETVVFTGTIELG